MPMAGMSSTATGAPGAAAATGRTGCPGSRLGGANAWSSLTAVRTACSAPAPPGCRTGRTGSRRTRGSARRAGQHADRTRSSALSDDRGLPRGRPRRRARRDAAVTCPPAGVARSARSPRTAARRRRSTPPPRAARRRPGQPERGDHAEQDAVGAVARHGSRPLPVMSVSGAVVPVGACRRWPRPRSGPPVPVPPVARRSRPAAVAPRLAAAVLDAVVPVLPGLQSSGAPTFWHLVGYGASASRTSLPFLNVGLSQPLVDEVRRRDGPGILLACGKRPRRG